MILTGFQSLYRWKAMVCLKITNMFAVLTQALNFIISCPHVCLIFGAGGGVFVHTSPYEIGVGPVSADDIKGGLSRKTCRL
jgi:hypothetical protein